MSAGDLLADLQRMPVRTALRKNGWTELRWREARTDPAFRELSDRAIGEREAKLINVIELCSAEDWRSAAWLAENTTGIVPKDVAQAARAEVLRILDELETRISGAAFREVVHALAGFLGEGEGEGVRQSSDPKQLASGRAVSGTAGDPEAPG